MGIFLGGKRIIGGTFSTAKFLKYVEEYKVSIKIYEYNRKVGLQLSNINFVNQKILLVWGGSSREVALSTANEIF